MKRKLAPCASRSSMTAPFHKSFPAVARARPAINRSNVVLPLPLEPRSTSAPPAFTLKFRLAKTRRPPRRHASPSPENDSPLMGRTIAAARGKKSRRVRHRRDFPATPTAQGPALMKRCFSPTKRRQKSGKSHIFQWVGSVCCNAPTGLYSGDVDDGAKGGWGSKLSRWCRSARRPPRIRFSSHVLSVRSVHASQRSR